ncbi:hypothetical protein [Ruoffia sp. FAM 20858]|uniref:hypothetical protein n=1 Tax=Ruoffia sp. FAM 20858 TaxID=3259516 RepID=UPI003889D605
MECANNLELKAKVENYVTIDKQISDLIERKLATSATYYTSHSLTGCMPLGETEVLYHRADTPEHIALTLWSKDIALQRKIDSLKQKQRLFQQCMGSEVLARLERDLRLFYVTELERQAYEAIGEVTYYLDEHRKTEERLKGFGLNEEQQAQMADVGNQLLSRIKELSL